MSMLLKSKAYDLLSDGYNAITGLRTKEDIATDLRFKGKMLMSLK